MTPYKKSLIQSIKVHKEPPWDDSDIYFTRFPWNLLGGVSSGICERWYWFTDDIIDAKCTEGILKLALIELLKGG